MPRGLQPRRPNFAVQSGPPGRPHTLTLPPNRRVVYRSIVYRSIANAEAQAVVAALPAIHLPADLSTLVFQNENIADFYSRLPIFTDNQAVFARTNEADETDAEEVN